jgi:hypothetical protein
MSQSSITTTHTAENFATMTFGVSDQHSTVAAKSCLAASGTVIGIHRGRPRVTVAMIIFVPHGIPLRDATKVSPRFRG